MVKNVLISTILFCSIFSCGLYTDIDMIRAPYNGNEIRTDGYYYYHNTNPTNPRYDIETDIKFFNRNGVCLNIYFFSYSDKIISYDTLGYIEKEVLSSKEGISSNLLNMPTQVGVFHVIGNKIETEEWLVRSPVNFSYDIINDTTIYSHYKKVVLKFKQFSPKPDSVSRFIP